MCAANASSVEHAPARCFFSTGQRKQLITVPSCPDHNEATSTNDEYIRNIFIGLTSLTDPDKGELLAKTFRSFVLSPKLKANIRSSMEIISYQGAEFWAVRLNWERLEAFTHKIACALHFKHYGRHLGAETSTVMRAGIALTEESPNNTAKIFGFVESANLEWRGGNPDIFKYQMLGEGLVPSTFRFVFYGDIDILVCPFGNPLWLTNPSEPLVVFQDQNAQVQGEQSHPARDSVASPAKIVISR